jgi:DNA-directed RNA polymerase specialized sigma24 family protein
MTDQIGTPVEAFLTPQEIEISRAFQVHYGAEVKLAVAALAETIGTSEEAKLEWVNAVASHLDQSEIDLEDRRDMALGIRWLATKLGGTATQDSLSLAPGLEPEAGQTDPSEHPTGLQETMARFAASSINGSDGLPGDRDLDPPATEPENPLSKQQAKWLGQLLPTEVVAQIEALPVHQRLDFAAKLGRMYQGLSIRRLGLESKKTRTEQMIAFIGGKSYVELADLYQVSPVALRNGLQRVPESINKKIQDGTIGLSDILRLIPKPEAADSADADAGDAAGSSEEASLQTLSPQQKSWYRKLFADFGERDSMVDNLNGISEPQQAYLAERLARYLRTYIIKAEGRVKTDRRVEAMSQFILGKSLEEIAVDVTLPVDTVKKDLHSSVSSLQRRTPQWNRSEILDSTVNLSPDDNGENSD